MRYFIIYFLMFQHFLVFSINKNDNLCYFYDRDELNIFLKEYQKENIVNEYKWLKEVLHESLINISYPFEEVSNVNKCDFVISFVSYKLNFVNMSPDFKNRTHNADPIFFVNGSVVFLIDIDISDSYGNNIETYRIKTSIPIYEEKKYTRGNYSWRSYHALNRKGNAKIVKISLNSAQSKLITKFSKQFFEELVNITKKIKLSKIYYDEINKITSKSEQLKNKYILWNGYLCKKNIKYNNTPFITITNEVEFLVNSYISQTDIDLNIPPAVEKPELPPIPKLTKSQFATKDMFEDRVENALSERKEKIFILQQQYRNNVEQRNNYISQLKEEYENSQMEKMNILPEKINEFTRASFFNVMGYPVLLNPTYNAEEQKMFLEIEASDATYKRKIELNIPLSDAEDFYNNYREAYPILLYNINDEGITLEAIKILHRDLSYSASLTNTEFSPEKLTYVLKDEKIHIDSLNQNQFTLQNPNLVDAYEVNAIIYSDDLEFNKSNDDLKPIISSLSSQSYDYSKWLFVIAIEDYDETDRVIYSKNSGELFLELSKKKFGIPSRNTYALINEKATSGAIKDKLRLLTENVKEGDQIIFYYSGHGVPSPNNQESYILPKDKIVDYIESDYEFKLSHIYNMLSSSNASEIYVFIDACFSGKTDNIPLFKGVAPGLIRTKNVSFDNNKMVVITAGKDNQFSNSFDEKGHRMFSYYLIKSLATRKDINIDLLYKDISVKVHDASFEKGDVYIQEPQIYGNKKLNLFNKE